MKKKEFNYFRGYCLCYCNISRVYIYTNKMEKVVIHL